MEARSVPSVIQIDPDIQGLHITFPSLSEIQTQSLTLIVAPRDPTKTGSLGLSDITVKMSGDTESITLIDKEGNLNPSLLEGMAAAGIQEQYSIGVDEGGAWRMHSLNKREGVPQMD